MFNIFYIFFVQAVFVLTSKYTTTWPTEKSAFFSTVLKRQGSKQRHFRLSSPFFHRPDNDRSNACFFATTWRRRRMRESNQIQRTMSSHALSCSPRMECPKWIQYLSWQKFGPRVVPSTVIRYAPKQGHLWQRISWLMDHAIWVMTN